MTIKYYLRNNTKNIYVSISEGRGHLFRYSTGYSLKKNSNWNDTTQKVRSVAEESYELINLQLKRLTSLLEENTYEARSKGIRRDKEFYGSLIKSFYQLEGKQIKSCTEWTIERAFELYISEAESPSKKVDIKDSTIKTYRTTLKCLQYFNMHKTLLTNIDMNWYYDFISMSEQGGAMRKPFSLNYIAKNIKKIKRALRFVEDSGQAVNPAFKSTSFKACEEEVDDIALSLDELQWIREIDIPLQNVSLTVTRDLFMIGCFTGLRVSDYKGLSKDNLKVIGGDEMFEIRSKKTEGMLTIPINSIVAEIMDSYGGNLPPSQKDYIINKNLKKLGLLAGLDDEVTIEKTEGGKRVARTFSKYELIKTHTARRSFCTNAYLLGVELLNIMAITGHKTEKNFLKYIKVTRHQRAKRIAEHKFFQ